MSTQYDTPSQQAPDRQPPDQQGGGRSRFRTWAMVIGTALVVAIVALTIGLLHSNGSQAPAAGGTPASASAPADAGNTNPTTPANTHPTTPVTPATPSAAVKKLQQELGQLNYYEGPDNGIMTAQTVQSIKYLQRDAHLPQTGQMDAATQKALANFLAHGNSQMNG